MLRRLTGDGLGDHPIAKGFDPQLVSRRFEADDIVGQFHIHRETEGADEPPRRKIVRHQNTARQSHALAFDRRLDGQAKLVEARPPSGVYTLDTGIRGLQTGNSCSGISFATCSPG